MIKQCFCHSEEKARGRKMTFARRFVHRLSLGSFILVGFICRPAGAAIGSGSVYLMPMNCIELLPESATFTGFFEAVAKGSATRHRALSKKMFRILALREKIDNEVDNSRQPNPVDTLIQKTICFYRENKEPLKPVTFDDSSFIEFLQGSVKDLEAKVETTVFQVELERFQRQEYERRASKDRSIIESLQKEADKDADVSYDRISNAARRKVRANE